MVTTHIYQILQHDFLVGKFIILTAILFFLVLI